MNTIKVQIKRRYTDAVLFEADIPADTPAGLQTRAALEKATAARANLAGADLAGAYLAGADLAGAYLDGASLDGARLDGANLGGAYLAGADLAGAYLAGADLVGANLGGASLDGARLDGANLDGIRSDFWDILLRAPREIAGLRAALVEGRVDGSTYEGECACLVGTIGNLRGVSYQSLANGIEPNSSRPAERWFLGIKKGDTPDTNQISRITVQWVDEFSALLDAAKVAS